MTTAQRTEKVAPLEKFAILAGEIDRLRLQIEGIRGQHSMDELLDVIEIDQLAEQFRNTPEVMRKKLVQAGGQVFKIGRVHVIRKIRFLEVLENLEAG